MVLERPAELLADPMRFEPVVQDRRKTYRTLQLKSGNSVASGGVREPPFFLLVKPAGYGLGVFIRGT